MDLFEKRGEVTVQNAIILAAGNSERFKINGELLPKVLFQIGGFSLLEIAITNLFLALDIKNFNIVLGAHYEMITEHLTKSQALKNLNINILFCNDYNLGNGLSLESGTRNLGASFMLTMCDHLFSQKTYKAFYSGVQETPLMPALACDPKINDIFDLDDATKVRSDRGLIAEIGKELDQYDLIDIGLFYFPSGSGSEISRRVKDGATSISQVVQGLVKGEGFRSVPLQEAKWQDIDDLPMWENAKKLFDESEIIGHIASAVSRQKVSL